uniref:Uncharacterized protein n=1 Tax=Arundo donax TaxID=35708 RepID=A0A0A8Y6V3_ARUDO
MKDEPATSKLFKCSVGKCRERISTVFPREGHRYSSIPSAGSANPTLSSEIYESMVCKRCWRPLSGEPSFQHSSITYQKIYQVVKSMKWTSND